LWTFCSYGMKKDEADPFNLESIASNEDLSIDEFFEFLNEFRNLFDGHLGKKPIFIGQYKFILSLVHDEAFYGHIWGFLKQRMSRSDYARDKQKMIGSLALLSSKFYALYTDILSLTNNKEQAVMRMQKALALFQRLSLMCYEAFQFYDGLSSNIKSSIVAHYSFEEGQLVLVKLAKNVIFLMGFRKEYEAIERFDIFARKTQNDKVYSIFIQPDGHLITEKGILGEKFYCIDNFIWFSPINSEGDFITDPEREVKEVLAAAVKYLPSTIDRDLAAQTLSKIKLPEISFWPFDFSPDEMLFLVDFFLEDMQQNATTEEWGKLLKLIEYVPQEEADDNAINIAKEKLLKEWQERRLQVEAGILGNKEKKTKKTSARGRGRAPIIRKDEKSKILSQKQKLFDSLKLNEQTKVKYRIAVRYLRAVIKQLKVEDVLSITKAGSHFNIHGLGEGFTFTSNTKKVRTKLIPVKYLNDDIATLIEIAMKQSLFLPKNSIDGLEG